MPLENDFKDAPLEDGQHQMFILQKINVHLNAVHQRILVPEDVFAQLNNNVI